MMELYVLEAARINGDAFDVIATFDKNEAIKAFESHIRHLTALEKATYKHILWTYRYEGKNANANEAWDEMLDEGMMDDKHVIDAEEM